MYTIHGMQSTNMGQYFHFKREEFGFVHENVTHLDIIMMRPFPTTCVEEFWCFLYEDSHYLVLSGPLPSII